MSLNHQVKKRFGQNFLTDKNLLQKIVNEAQIDHLNVIEIGPGRGALTTFLTKQAKKYVGFEIDLTLKDLLMNNFNQDNTKFFFTDFMKADVADIISQEFQDQEVHLVANLPYYITTPIIFEFLSLKQLTTATIMVQKEVGLRLISANNEKSYNALSAILQYYCDVVKVLDVNRKMFNPVPNVDSMVIRLKKLPPRLKDETFYVKFVKVIFSQKRKLAINNLVNGFDVNKELVRKFLETAGFSDTIRAEQLTINELIELSTAFQKAFNYWWDNIKI